MDNLQDNTQSSGSPSQKGNRSCLDLIKQANDDSKRQQEEMHTKEIIMRGVGKQTSVTDMTLLPNQFRATGGGTQVIPSVGDIIESMLHFKWTILMIFVIVATPAIAAIWTLINPKYQAEAELRVRPTVPYLVFRTEESGNIPFYDSFVNTQVSIISSSAVLQRVLDQPEVQQTQWYKNPQISLIQQLLGSPPNLKNSLKKALSVKPRRETEIIDVTFVDSSAIEAQLIVNTVLDHYIKYIEVMSDATADVLYRQLVDQYKSLENEILGREKIIVELHRTLGTGTPEELISEKRIRLDETEARLSQVRQSIALLEWEKKRAIAIIDDSNDMPAATVGTTQRQPKYYEDEEWRKLDADVRTIRHNIANSLLKPNHPDAARIEKQLEFAQEQLKLRELQIDEQWRDRLNNPAGVLPIAGAGNLSYEEGLIYVEHQLARSKYEEQILAGEFKKQQAEYAALFESAQLLESENNALLHKRELFSAVRERLDQKNVERNVPVSIEILNRASLPLQPYNDRRIEFTALVLILALGAGSGLAYLRAGRNQTIYTAKDMPHTLQAPFLGYIPMIDTRRSSLESLASRKEQTQNGKSRMIESIRIVRTALLARLKYPENNTLLVTSTREVTRKSSFTLMLGNSLAQGGKKVLMIDVDFSNMALTRHFEDLFNQSGFIQSLRRRSIYKRHVFQTQTLGLSILPAGKRDDNSEVLEEIANGAFNFCIAKLRKQYDIILLDSPPILPLADTMILSGQVDGTIMVEQANISLRSDMFNALDRLSSAGGHFMGTVLIGSDD